MAEARVSDLFVIPELLQLGVDAHKLDADLLLRDFNRSDKVSCCCSSNVGAGLNWTTKKRKGCTKLILAINFKARDFIRSK